MKKKKYQSPNFVLTKFHMEETITIGSQGLLGADPTQNDIDIEDWLNEDSFDDTNFTIN